jgi:hypothetical protein
VKTRLDVITFDIARPIWSVQVLAHRGLGIYRDRVDVRRDLDLVVGCPSCAISHTITRFPRLAADPRRQAATVVLPTPPFPVTKTSRLSRRKATYASEYRTPYGSVRTKESQSAGVSAVTLVRHQRSRGAAGARAAAA